jgi:D-alanyl-D-alanine carboxypeptidase
MLPSGNDAAWALAEYFGAKLTPNGKPVKRFLDEMNKNAQMLGLNSTIFHNPHGLIVKRNLSTAKDVARLAVHAMKNEVFKYIVGCKSFTARIVAQDGSVREEVWENTNKLLGKGFDGVKTGITSNAGPCLCVCTSKDFYVVIVLLNSESMDARWVEAKKLSQWARLKFY